MTQRCIVGVTSSVRGAQLEYRGEAYRPFQLFGFDFLIDTRLRVWLCEINASPAVADEPSHPVGSMLKVSYTLELLLSPTSEVQTGAPSAAAAELRRRVTLEERREDHVLLGGGVLADGHLDAMVELHVTGARVEGVGGRAQHGAALPVEAAELARVGQSAALVGGR